METAESLTLISAGVFFLVGLLTGVWKYRQIMASDNGQAHPYVDICHRAALLYSFAAILLVKFIEVSQLPNYIEFIAAAAILVYFAGAIAGYAVHGYLQDTENQLRPPFRMAGREVPRGAISVHMWMLISAEIGGFLVLFYGVITALI